LGLPPALRSSMFPTCYYTHDGVCIECSRKALRYVRKGEELRDQPPAISLRVFRPAEWAYYHYEAVAACANLGNFRKYASATCTSNVFAEDETTEHRRARIGIAATTRRHHQRTGGCEGRGRKSDAVVEEESFVVLFLLGMRGGSEEDHRAERGTKSFCCFQ